MLARWITALMVSASPSPTTVCANASLRACAPGIAGDAIGAVRLDVLERELDVIEPRLLEPREPGRVEPDRRGDQVGVEPGLARRGDDLDQVAARRRLAAGQMDLQHAHRRRFAKHARPGRGVQFVGPIVQGQRVGAIRAGEGTAMRQLGQQAERRRNSGVARAHATIRLVASSASMSFTSPSISARSAV